MLTIAVIGLYLCVGTAIVPFIIPNRNEKDKKAKN